MAQYYVRVDTYWENSPDTFFGPYPSRLAASAALNDSSAARSDLGQSAGNVRVQTRCLGILTETQARRAGMNFLTNTISAQDVIPGTVCELQELEELFILA